MSFYLTNGGNMQGRALTITQDEAIDRGRLQINVTSEIGLRPIKNATISISYTGNPTQILEQLTTNDSGQTETVELSAPPIEYSLQPSEVQPYSEYNIQVNAEGFEPVDISGTEILSETTAVQPIQLRPLEENQAEDNIVIPAHTLFGEYPPKIAEAEIKPVNESGEIVLSRVVVPEYVVVHDGTVLLVQKYSKKYNGRNIVLVINYYFFYYIAPKASFGFSCINAIY